MFPYPLLSPIKWHEAGFEKPVMSRAGEKLHGTWASEKGTCTIGILAGWLKVRLGDLPDNHYYLLYSLILGGVPPKVLKGFL